MKFTIYIFITIHTLCIKRSIIGVFEAKRTPKLNCVFQGRQKIELKSPTKNIRRQLHSIPYFCKQKDSCYTKVLQKFMAKPHNFLLRLKSPHKVIKHITTENIHKILWKVYCFELASCCTPLPHPHPQNLLLTLKVKWLTS